MTWIQLLQWSFACAVAALSVLVIAGVIWLIVQAVKGDL